jgi:glycosyltransferase involved in cell wall biosynthesis
LRILHALHSFAPESHGGIQTYVQMLVRAQRARGDEVAVLAGSDRVDASSCGIREETVGGTAVARLTAPGLAHEEREAAATAAIAAHLTARPPDLLHVHHWHNLCSESVRLARRRGIAAVVSLHDLYATCPLFFRAPEPGVLCAPELPRDECVRCIGRHLALPQPHVDGLLHQRETAIRGELLAANAVLALSGPQREFLARVPLLDGVPVRALPLPRPDVPAPAARWQPPADGGLRLVTWGGLVPGKGLHVLVEACERLPDAARIAIDHYGKVLDDGYRQRLLQAARRVRLSLHGDYDARDMAERFPAYDLMVFPSLFLETHGFAVDEALSLGLPLLVGDRGAPATRVGARGRVFPTGDVAALAGHLAGLMARPGQLAEMRAAAPLPQPSQAEHAAALAEVYTGALAWTRA